MLNNTIGEPYILLKRLQHHLLFTGWYSVNNGLFWSFYTNQKVHLQDEWLTLIRFSFQLWKTYSSSVWKLIQYPLWLFLHWWRSDFFRQGHHHSLVKFQAKLLFMAYLAQMMETSRSRKVSRLTGFEWGSKSYWHWNAIRGSREELKPIWATNRSYQRDGKLNSKFDKSGLCP